MLPEPEETDAISISTTSSSEPNYDSDSSDDDVVNIFDELDDGLYEDDNPFIDQYWERQKAFEALPNVTVSKVSRYDPANLHMKLISEHYDENGQKTMECWDDLRLGEIVNRPSMYMTLPPIDADE